MVSVNNICYNHTPQHHIEMKNYIYIAIIAIMTVVMTSCNGNEGTTSTQQDNSTQLEQQKQDSIHEANAEAERIKKEQEEQARLQRISQLPEWIDGVWELEGGSLPKKIQNGKISPIESNGNCPNWCPIDYVDGKIIISAWSEKYVINHSTHTLELEGSSCSYHKRGTEQQNEKNNSSDNEAQILNQLQQLGERGRQMMPRIETLYQRQQQAQRNGILSNPQAQFDLKEAIDELIDIKNKQIRLAEQLGDPQLVKEYKEQRSQIVAAQDRMLYGI